MGNESLGIDPLPRSNRPLSRLELGRLLGLFKSQTWLERRADKVQDLWDLCRDVDEQSLILDLLHRFVYLNGDGLAESFARIRDQILKKWECVGANTKVVALNEGHSSDSSEAMLWHLKPEFSGCDGWSDTNFIKSSIVAANEKISSGDIVVLFDEFVGSGKQAQRQINKFMYLLKKRNCVPAKIYLCIIAKMIEQKYKFAELVDDCYFDIQVPKGITDHYPGDERDKAICRMLRIEARLQRVHGGRKMPTLGHERSEAIYSCELGNTPNNVFPVFWWSWLRGGVRRQTILKRSGY